MENREWRMGNGEHSAKPLTSLALMGEPNRPRKVVSSLASFSYFPITQLSHCPMFPLTMIPVVGGSVGHPWANRFETA